MRDVNEDSLILVYTATRQPLSQLLSYLQLVVSQLIAPQLINSKIVAQPFMFNNGLPLGTLALALSFSFFIHDLTSAFLCILIAAHAVYLRKVGWRLSGDIHAAYDLSR